jgi:hypothetical protein
MHAAGTLRGDVGDPEAAPVRERLLAAARCRVEVAAEDPERSGGSRRHRPGVRPDPTPARRVGERRVRWRRSDIPAAWRRLWTQPRKGARARRPRRPVSIERRLETDDEGEGHHGGPHRSPRMVDAGPTRSHRRRWVRRCCRRPCRRRCSAGWPSRLRRLRMKCSGSRLLPPHYRPGQSGERQASPGAQPKT